MSDWPVLESGRGGLLGYFLLREFEPYRALAAEQNQLNLREAKEIWRHAATTLVMEERTDESRCVRAVSRPYDQRRDGSGGHAGHSAAMTSSLPRNRLGLAQWLFTE